jgi:hypothetical protein
VRAIGFNHLGIGARSLEAIPASTTRCSAWSIFALDADHVEAVCRAALRAAGINHPGVPLAARHKTLCVTSLFSHP